MKQALPDKEANIRRAIDYLKRNRPLRAEEACRDFLKENPGDTDHIRLLSLALMKQSRVAEAEEQLRFALSLEPDFPQLHEDLGSALAMQSRFEEAIPEFEKAIRLQPALPLARKKLGQALAAVGRGAEADEAFREYIDKDPEHAAIVKGIELQRADKTDEATDIFQDVLRKNPNNVNVHPVLRAIHVVDVHLVQHQRSFVRHRVKTDGLEAIIRALDVHRPVKSVLVEMKTQDAVESSRGQIQGALPDRDLMAVFEERGTPGIDALEIGCVSE